MVFVDSHPRGRVSCVSEQIIKAPGIELSARDQSRKRWVLEMKRRLILRDQGCREGGIKVGGNIILERVETQYIKKIQHRK